MLSNSELSSEMSSNNDDSLDFDSVDDGCRSEWYEVDREVRWGSDVVRGGGCRMKIPYYLMGTGWSRGYQHTSFIIHNSS